MARTHNGGECPADGSFVSYVPCCCTKHDAQDDGFVLLAPIHLPISIALKAELQKAVLGIVTLAAVGTLQIASPRRSLTIIVFRNCEGSSATTRHQKQFKVGIGF